MDGLFNYLCAQLYLCLYATISMYTDITEKKSLAVYPKDILTACDGTRIDHFSIARDEEGYRLFAVVYQNNQALHYAMPGMNFIGEIISSHEEVKDVLLRAIGELSHPC